MEKTVKSKSSVESFVVKNNTLTFDDVAGLDEVKNAVRNKVIYPKIYPTLYKTFKFRSGGGILLYGLPGTGKTMIAKAIACETGAKLFAVSPSLVQNMYFGNSEKIVRKLFCAAKEEENAIIFIDELEGIAVSRDAKNEHGRGIVTEMLMQIQGVADQDNSNLLIIAATNRPWDVDSAFLRPGRFDERIFVPLPSESARKSIIAHAIHGIPGATTIRIDEVVKATEGFNGADVEFVCNKAKELAISRVIAGKRKVAKFTQTDFNDAVELVSSSVSATDLERLEKWRNANTRIAV